MYGMVNKAIEQMVVLEHGEAVWEEILEKSGVDVEVFVSTQGYPDQVTYALVQTAADVLHVSVAEILEAFGVHWVIRTAQEGYGDMMAGGGRTLSEFLVNLPNFHSRVAMIFPHLAPPQFLCGEVTERSVLMHYRSQREGLAPFAVGLFKGLGQLFSTPVTVEHTLQKAAGADHDEFLICW